MRQSDEVLCTEHERLERVLLTLIRKKVTKTIVAKTLTKNTYSTISDRNSSSDGITEFREKDYKLTALLGTREVVLKEERRSKTACVIDSCLIVPLANASTSCRTRLKRRYCANRVKYSVLLSWVTGMEDPPGLRSTTWNRTREFNLRGSLAHNS